MSERRRDLLMFYLLGVAVNAVVALLVTSPGYPDAFYYFNGAVKVAAGGPLVEPYIWNYTAAPAALPAPAFGYWQPLPSFLGALGIWLLPNLPAFGAAQAVFTALAGLVPVLAYLAAELIGGPEAGAAALRRHARLAAALALFGGIYLVYWSLPESFTPFALAGAGALLLAAQARRTGQRRLWLAAGVCAGLGHLSRADGMLLVPVLVVSIFLWPRGVGKNRPKLDAGEGLRAAAAVVAGYLIVMAPWFARNLRVFGSLQAPGGLDTLWLVDYKDMFTYPPNLTPQRFFAAGTIAILATQARALLLNLATFVGVHNLVFLTPLTLVGWGRRWRRDGLLPVTLYGVGLFLAMSIPFALPGMRGGWLHSGAALAPFVAAAAALGLDDVVTWAARRRADWQEEEANRVFSAAAVAFAAALSAAMILVRVVGLDDVAIVTWNQPAAIYAQMGEALDAAGASTDARVMSNDPAGLYAVTGHGGVPLVNGGEADLLRAADDYGVSYLVIDQKLPFDLWSLFSDGPDTPRLELRAQIGEGGATVFVYRILPAE